MFSLFQSSSTDEIAKLGVASEVGRSDESGQMAECPTQSVSVCPATGSASQVAIVSSDSAQYAVVRKALKKSHSLSECPRASDTMPPGQEVKIFNLNTIICPNIPYCSW